VPTYQYACTACDHSFEQFQSFSDDALTVCPECQGRLRKVFNAVGVVFKGSGFYRTDSRKDARGDSAGAGTGSGSTGAGSKSSGSESAASSSSTGGSGSGSGTGGSGGSSSASTTTSGSGSSSSGSGSSGSAA
jgi:putative FmdB family regulatory protein